MPPWGSLALSLWARVRSVLSKMSLEAKNTIRNTFIYSMNAAHSCMCVCFGVAKEWRNLKVVGELIKLGCTHTDWFIPLRDCSPFVIRYIFFPLLKIETTN